MEKNVMYRTEKNRVPNPGRAAYNGDPLEEQNSGVIAFCWLKSRIFHRKDFSTTAKQIDFFVLQNVISKDSVNTCDLRVTCDLSLIRTLYGMTFIDWNQRSYIYGLRAVRIGVRTLKWSACEKYAVINWLIFILSY